MVLIENYNKISDIVPSHIDITGKIDQYSNKKSLIVITIVNIIILSFIWLLIKKPHLANYPLEITEVNKVSIYKKMQVFLAIIAIITTSAFSYLIFKTVHYENEFIYFLFYIIISPLLVLLFFNNKY
ncbi:hypothetical protein BKM63_02665 [Flavobacterium johnsoniae]|uniref:DUF1648 domain-containing protein n=2 Tax=Flavobacterium johnsoniae TaxID=986 RepID=A0A1J7BWV4_FLAJO|nr:hypothetical protein BKM63_02665 [Flavobacterium johnsoniae]